MTTTREPMLRATHREPDMLLPDGKTCADCVHFQRCNAIYGHIAADEVCDWAPSRFYPRPVADAGVREGTDRTTSGVIGQP